MSKQYTQDLWEALTLFLVIAGVASLVFWLVACEAISQNKVHGRDMQFDCEVKHPDGTHLICHVDGQIHDKQDDKSVEITK